MWLEILVSNLATNFQDLVAKVKNLVALASVLGAILRPVLKRDYSWRTDPTVQITGDHASFFGWECRITGFITIWLPCISSCNQTYSALNRCPRFNLWNSILVMFKICNSAKINVSVHDFLPPGVMFNYWKWNLKRLWQSCFPVFLTCFNSRTVRSMSSESGGCKASLSTALGEPISKSFTFNTTCSSGHLWGGK